MVVFVVVRLQNLGYAFYVRYEIIPVCVSFLDKFNHAITLNYLKLYFVTYCSLEPLYRIVYDLI